MKNQFSIEYLKKYHLKSVVIIVISLLLISALVTNRLSSDQYFGEWICENGRWITLDNPYEEKPQWLCPQATPTPLPPAEQLEAIAIKIYLARRNPSNSACDEVYPVERKIMKMVDQQVMAMEAIDELLKGPTNDEIALGFYSTITDEDIKPEQISYVNGVITLNTKAIFRARNESFCETARKTRQMSETLKSLPFINAVNP